MAERKLTWEVKAITDRASGSIKNIDKQFDGLKGKMQGVSQNMKDLGSSMTSRKFTAVVTGTAIAGVKAVSDFDDGLSQVKAKTQATTEDMNKMRAMALDLGKGARGPSEIVDAMDILGSAGKSTNEILAMTPDLTTLMSAGAVDADTSARALTGTMAQFNMEADQSGRIVDVFAKGASSSKTNVSELTSALSMAGGELANMNMDIEKATALAGVMADANIEGSRAGTTMSAMARDIKANSKAFESMGISVYDANGQMQDMGSTLSDLQRALEGKTDAQRDAMLADLFTGQSLRGVNAFLAQGSEKYQELENAMYNAKGESARMAEDMEDNIGGAFRKLKNSGKVFLIEFGEVFKDDVQGWATGLADLAGKVADVDKDTMKLIGTGALFLAGVGPITSAIGGIIGGLSSVLGVLTGITGLVMANPWILGATAAVVGGKKLYDYGIKKRDERLDDMRKGKAKTINIKPMPADTHVMGSHKDGLSTVPFDGYVAELHEDEEVLTADDPRNINNNKVPGQNISVSMPINIAVEGNATEDTALEVGKETRRVVRNELDIFFQKLNVQLGGA